MKKYRFIEKQVAAVQYPKKGVFIEKEVS